eukprot:448610-Prorocentrum_minimum.AAC.2
MVWWSMRAFSASARYLRKGGEFMRGGGEFVRERGEYLRGGAFFTQPARRLHQQVGGAAPAGSEHRAGRQESPLAATMAASVVVVHVLRWQP